MLSYSDGSLFWRFNAGGKAFKGSEAGTINDTGYMYISIKNKKYRLHRIIFLYHHGFLPRAVDHVDGDKLNNKIENLRGCSLSENQYNSTTRKDNTSGVKGVSFHKMSDKWQAVIRFKGKQKHLGLFGVLYSAENTVKAERERLHKEFANHGKS